MNAKIKQKIVAITMFLVVASPVAFMPSCVSVASAADPTYGLEGFNVDIGKTATGEDAATNIKDSIASVINIVLGFLGVIAVVIILYAGFKWMTAGGNEDAVGEAKKMIIQAIIGLVIIFLAWIIAGFVITQIHTATTKP